MDHITSKMLMYGDMPKDSILMELSDICTNLRDNTQSRDVLVTRIYKQIKRILVVATEYAFDKNLWHNYLTFLLITDENPFSITCEKVGASDGSINDLVKNDFQEYMYLFNYDFSWIENALGIDCFSRISNYKAIQKPELMYNKNVSEKVRALSEKLETAQNADEFFTYVTDFYKAYGVGMFGLNKAFRIKSKEDGVEFIPINNMDKVMLDDLIGYEIQKKKLVDNTKAFVEGRKANNVLLFGDSGTGKSTSIKAIVNQFYDDGLRFLRRKHDEYDLIINDSTDPLGHTEGLFTKEFYGSCYKALKDDGIMVYQHGSPFYDEDELECRKMHRKVYKSFPISRVYQAHIPTCPSGYWLFGFASKKYHPLYDLDAKRWDALGLKTWYYTTHLHRGAFMLPKYVEDLLEEEETK